jgi:hypothetical protein
MQIFNSDPLRISNGMVVARRAIDRTRAARDAAEAEARRLAESYRDGARVSIGQVHEAEAEASAARDKHNAARREFDFARENFNTTWLGRCRPVSDKLVADVNAAAGQLEQAIADAVAFDSFATANGLPVTRALADVRRLTQIVAELRNVEN